LEGDESTTLDVKPDAPGEDVEDERLRAILGAKLFGRREKVEIDRFRIVGRLGSGGMGIVYDAWDPKLRRRVALKVVRPDRTDGPIDRRLLREARSAAQLKHPNVVTVYEAGEVDELVWIAMEFIDGHTISDWLEAAPPATPHGWREIVALYIDAGRGLAEAHRRGLIHRDFKPDNVLVESRDGEAPIARVVDFGLARKSRDGPDAGQSIPDLKASISDEEETAAGRVMGTPAYMAPEQMAGLTIDARADQFAFCVSLYESLEGTRPFAGTTLHEVLVGIEDGLVRRPRKRLPRWLFRAIQRGLAYEPDERFDSMNELLERLESGLARRRRHGWVAVAGGAVAVAGLAFAWPSRLDDPCREAATASLQVWSPARQQATAAWFEAGEGDYPRAAGEAFADNLDGWIARWNAMRTETCRAAQLEARQSDELRDRRDACLDRQLRRVDALVSGLRAEPPNPERVAQVASAGSQLPDLDLCANASWLLAAAPMEGSPDERQRARSLDDTLSELEGSAHTSDPTRLVERAATAREEATDLGNAPLIARAWAIEGRAHSLLGDHERAREGLRRAFRAAIRGSAEDIAAEAALGAAWTQIEHHDDLDDARRWLGDADAFITALGDPPRLRATWLDHSGVLAYIEGDFERSESLHRRALALREGTPGLEFAAAQTRVNLAGVLASRKEVDQALTEFSQARELFEQRVGPGHPVLAQLATNESVALLRAGRIDDAIAAGERALEIKRALYGPDNHRLASTLVNLANARWEGGDHDAANADLARAIKLREAELGPDHKTLVGPLINLGLGYEEVNKPVEALGPYERAHAIALENWPADHPDVLYAGHGRARSLVAMGRTDDAGQVLDPLIDALDRVRIGKSIEAEMAASILTLRAKLHLASNDRARAEALIARAEAACETPKADCTFEPAERARGE